MDDIWTIIVAVSTALSAVFLFLGWYYPWKEKKDRVLVTRFMENNQWYIRVRTKYGILGECTVVFDNQDLLGKISQSPINIVQGAENFQFWASNMPSNLDKREIIVKDRGKKIYNRKFNELIREK